MGTQGRGAVLGVLICMACASGERQHPSTAIANWSPLSPLAPPSAPFKAPSANPARKAKLLALAPQLDQLYRSRLTEVGATGAAVGILLEGEVVYLQGFGVREAVSKAAIDADTVFRIGSVSKSITALAILRLRDQGRLVLDAPASTYLPALRAIAAPTKDSTPITVRHLLTMTSGLAYDDQWGAVTYGKNEAELEAYLAGGLSLADAPGARYRYSNLGYALLGRIVANVSGKSFEQYVSSEIFAPLGLTASGYVTGQVPLQRMATGYYRDGAQLVPESVESDGVFAPAGGVFTTARDLARYAAFQLAAYPPRDELETGPVRRSTVREMHNGQAWARFSDDQPVVAIKPDGSTNLLATSYGFGWLQLTSCLAEGIVQHGGYEPGYWTSIRLVPRQGIGVVALSTTENLGTLRTFELTFALLRDGGVLDAPTPKASASLVAARDHVLQLLAQWEPGLVARTFDPQSLRFSFLRNLRPDFERMGHEHGACHPDGDIVPVGLTQGRFRLACERGSVDFVSYLTPGAPPLLQSVEYHESLPVTEQQQAAARALTLALNGVALAPAVVDPGADVRVLQKRLARLHGIFGNCELDAPLSNDGKGQATFRLRCAEGPLELTLRLDPKASLIADVSGARPRPPGSPCVE